MLNTELLKRLMKGDPRVPELVLLVKLWAKRRGVADASNATLSSYTWTLLVINFCQAEGLLRPGEPPRPQATKPLSATQLMIKFFAFYGGGKLNGSGVGFNKNWISIGWFGSGGEACSPEQSSAPCWRMCISDPIESGRDLGRPVHAAAGMVFILNELHRAWRIIHDHCISLPSASSVDTGPADRCFDDLFYLNADVPIFPRLCFFCVAADHTSEQCARARCGICGGAGHLSLHCTRDLCHRCQGGHKTKDCPKKSMLGSSSKTYADALARQDISVDKLAFFVGQGDNTSTFVENFLSWEVKEFTNEALLQDTLVEIPNVFETAHNFYSVFLPCLLEEFRANLESAVTKKLEEVRQVQANFLLKDGRAIFLNVHAEGNYSEISSTMPSVGLFVEKCPAPQGLTLAKILTLNHVLVDISFQLDRKDERNDVHYRGLAETDVLFIYTLPSTRQAARLEAVNGEGWMLLLLNVGTTAPTRVHRALLREGQPALLSGILRGAATTQQQFFPEHGNAEAGQANGGSNESLSDLNESQRRAVSRVLDLEKSVPIQLIKGPPGTYGPKKYVVCKFNLPSCTFDFYMAYVGTGKTKSVVALLLCLAARQKRVHVAAPTNVAVTELARRTLATVQCTTAPVMPAATAPTGTENTPAEPPFSSLPLSRLLLVGSGARLKLGPDDPLCAIWLDARLERLTRALSVLPKLCCDLSNIMRSTIGIGVLKKTAESKKLAVGAVMLGLVCDLQLLALSLIDEAPPFCWWGLRAVAISELRALFSDLVVVSESDFEMWLLLHLQNLETESAGRRPALSTTCLSANGFDIGAKCHRISALLSTLQIKIKINNLKFLVMEEALLIFSTVNAGGREIFDHVRIDVAVIDEATQLVQAEMAIVLQENLTSLVLVGDDKQLPATVISPNALRMKYDVSLFSRLLGLGYPSSLLETQYRMHPAISRWPRVQFYEGKVVDGENVKSEAYNKSWHNEFPPLSVYDVSVGKEESNAFGSKFNVTEVMVVTQILRSIKRAVAKLSVGIVSPYEEQVNRLLHLEGGSATAATGVTCRVCTIDGYQGQESDIIIFSAVRSNNKRKIGFLEDLRRLNVALTRARFCLIIVCNVATVSNNETWADLIDHVRTHNSMFNAQNCYVIKKCEKTHQLTKDRMLQISASGGSAFEDAPWHVTVADEFRTTISKLDSGSSIAVIEKVLKLAHGEWPAHELRSSQVSDKFRDIVHTYRLAKIWVVWSVDVQISTCTQCIKVWDAVSEVRIKQVIRRLEGVLKTFSDGYIQRCAQKDLRRDTSKYMPHSWTHDKNFLFYKVAVVSGKTGSSICNVNEVELERSSVAASAALTKFYPLSSHIARLLLFADRLKDIELPFEMSSEEEDIVRFSGSQLIIGRSGTG